jgi:L1 cell adhesion molecule like protein
VPQIEVTFDVDANAILNVSASDKSSGKAEKITITNDKGRLSKDDIERMVSDAEKYAEEDKKEVDRIAARNNFESFAFRTKNSLNEEAIASKISAEDKEKVTKAVDSAIEFLESSQSASKEEYDERQKELESVTSPIFSALYGQAGGAPGGAPGGMPGGAPGAGASEPSVEELD